MTATLFAFLIPLSLVLITFGLGMTLDRRHVVDTLSNRGVRWMAAVWWLLLPATAFVLAIFTPAQRDIRIGIALLGALPVGFVANVFASYVQGEVAITLSAVGITTLCAPIAVGLWGTGIAAYFDVSGPTRLIQVVPKVLPVVLFGTLPAVAGYFAGSRMSYGRLKVARLLRDAGTLCLATAFLSLMAGDIHAFLDGIRAAALPVVLFNAICVFVGWACSLYVAPRSAARSAWLTCFLRQEETGIFFAVTCLGLPGATTPLLVNVVTAMSLGIAFTLIVRRIRNPAPLPS